MVRRCFVDSNADVISSVHVSWRGAPARASVRGCIVVAMFGKKRR